MFLLVSCYSVRCLRRRAEKRFKNLATTPTTLAYMALRDTMGSKLKLNGGLSTVVKDMFSKIDLDNNGVLERDEIRCECVSAWLVWMLWCLVYEKHYSHGGDDESIMMHTRSFLVDMEDFEDEETSTAEYLDEAVNAIFEVIKYKSQTCLEK